MAANRGITELTSFKALSWIFGLLILGSIISISFSILPDYSISLTSQGFKRFFELYDAPIKLVGSYGAILGLISLNHRSIQTKVQLDISSKQIELSRSQNQFTNYYQHREEFIKYTEKIATPLGSNPIDTAVLVHSNLFPNAKNGDYDPYEIVTSDFFERLSKILIECDYCFETDQFNLVKDSIFKMRLDCLFNDLKILTGTAHERSSIFEDINSLHDLADSVHIIGSTFYLLLSDYWVMARFEKDIQTRGTRDIMRALGELKDNFKCNTSTEAKMQIEPYLKNITKAISKLKA